MTLLKYFENKANRQAYFWEKEILEQVQNAVKQIKQDAYLVINCPSRSGKRFLINCINEYYKFERNETMEQKLQELKEKITSFVRDYEIESFDVWIDKKVGQKVKVNLEIRV